MTDGGKRRGSAGARWRLLLGAVLASCCELAQARAAGEPRRPVLLLKPAYLLEQSDTFVDERSGAPWSSSVPLLRTRPVAIRDDRDRHGPSVRGGIGLDLNLPDTGKLHLDLLPARDVTRQGMRWQVSGDQPVALGKLWSLGGCLDMIRSRRSNPNLYSGYGGYGGDRHLQLAPQLILDMDAFTGSDSVGRLIVQRGHWNDLSGNDAGAGAVWQARVVWRF